MIAFFLSGRNQFNLTLTKHPNWGQLFATVRRNRDGHSVSRTISLQIHWSLHTLKCDDFMLSNLLTVETLSTLPAENLIIHHVCTSDDLMYYSHTIPSDQFPSAGHRARHLPCAPLGEPSLFYPGLYPRVTWAP